MKRKRGRNKQAMAEEEPGKKSEGRNSSLGAKEISSVHSDSEKKARRHGEEQVGFRG